MKTPFCTLICLLLLARPLFGQSHIFVFEDTDGNHKTNVTISDDFLLKSHIKGIDFTALEAQDYQREYSAATEAIRKARDAHAMLERPEEARAHFVMGTTLFKDAKTKDDYRRVIDEFSSAVKVAPWWPEAHYNLALVYEADGQFLFAVLHLKLYLECFSMYPTTSAVQVNAETRKIRDWIYQLRAKAQKEEDYVPPPPEDVRLK